MRVNLSEMVRGNPKIADQVFDGLDGALNKVLPGIKTPERYEDIGEVGLAVVVGKAAHIGDHNPFSRRTLRHISYINDNRHSHPNAWTPKDTDEEILGGVIPPGMGRFAAYALAKIHAIDDSPNPDLSSHEAGGADEPGKVNYAGGVAIAQSLVGVSGLWEVHDHVTAGIFAGEVIKASVSGVGYDKTDDEFAAQIEPVFAKVTTFHEGVSADDLSRRDVSILLQFIDAELMPKYPYLDGI